MANIGEATVKLGVDDKEFKSKLGGVGKEIEGKLGGVSGKLNKIGTSMTAVGGAMTKGITLPLIGAGIAVTKMSMDFNKGMANVATLIPGNTKRVQELKGEVQNLAIATGKSTTDMSNGLYQVISAFGDTADTTKILEINAKSASAGMAETTDAINLTSAVTKGYGDTSAGAVQKVSDLALLTVRLGQTTYPELASSMGKVTPIASALKISQEELFGAFATLTGVTGTAAEVSTQLRGSFSGLMKPTKEMQNAIQKSGFSTGEAMLKSLGLQGTLMKLKEAVGGNTTEFVNLFGSIESAPALLAMTGEQADVLKDKTNQMGNSAGATDTAFKEMTSGVNKTGFTWEQLQVKLTVVAQKLGDALAPALSGVLDKLTPMIDKVMKLVQRFATLPQPVQNAVLKFLAFLAILGPIILIVGKFAASISSIVGVFGKLSPLFVKLIPALGKLGGGFGALKGAIAAISGPVGWVVAAIAILVLGFIRLYKTNEDFRARVTALWAKIKQIFGSSFEAIKRDVLNTFDFIWTLIKGVLDRIVDFLSIWAAIFTGDWKGAWEGIKSLVKNSFNNMVESVKSGFNLMTGKARESKDGVVGQVREMSNQSTAKVVEMSQKINQDLFNLQVSGKAITKGMADGIIANSATMKDEAIKKINEQYTGTVNKLKMMRDDSKIITAEQYTAMMEIETKRKDEQIQNQKDLHTQVAEEIKRLKESGVTVTAEMAQEIEARVKKQTESCVLATSGQKEQTTAILAMLKVESGQITQDMAQKAIQDSATQRDKTIENANKQYKDTVIAINNMSDETILASGKTRDELIADAKKQRDGTVTEANGMHDEVVTKVSGMCGSVKTNVNTTTGETLTTWEKLRIGTSEKWTSLKANTSETWENVRSTISKKTSSALDKVIKWASSMWTEAKKAGKNIFDGVWNAIKGLPKKLYNLGKNILSELTRGITKGIKESGLGKAVGSVAKKIRGFLPSSPAKEGALKDIHKLDFGTSISKSLLNAKKIVGKSSFSLGEVAMTGLSPQNNLQSNLLPSASTTNYNNNAGISIVVTGNNISNGIDINNIANQIIRKLKNSGVY